WYHEAVKFVSEHGLFKGISADEFGPDIPITRGMFVTILSRLEFGGDDGVPDLESPFVDLEQNWYKKAVAWAYENRITLGISATEFDPDGILTREQMAVFLYRYAQYKNYDLEYDGEVLVIFIDQDEVSGFADPGLPWAVDQGLLTGTSATVLAPKDQASRAQAAAIFMRFASLFQD
ncbi:MAG TPA: S-layer homology domain-containing protein, partial [bacterium]|nr:S-layer homology domain-containing protein [bacterium]